MSFSWEDLKRQLDYDEKLERADKELAEMRKKLFDNVWEFYDFGHKWESAILDKSNQELQKRIQLFLSHLESGKRPDPEVRQILLAFCVDHEARHREIKLVAESLGKLIRQKGFFFFSDVGKARHDARTSTTTEDVFKARLRRLWYGGEWMGKQFLYPRLYDKKHDSREYDQAFKTLFYTTVRKLYDLPPLIIQYRETNLAAERAALRQLTTQSWRETGFSPQTRHLVRYWSRRETLSMTLAMASSSAAKRFYSILMGAARRLL